MFVIPIGAVGERGNYVLTVLIVIACIVSFACVSDDFAIKGFAYYPDTLNVARMLTSQFMHADILHLLGNLFFFIGFSASIERRVGMSAYIFTFVVVSLVASFSYHAASHHAEDALPTIGLSGVVWGFMGMFLAYSPKAELSCIVVYLVGLKKIEIPSWMFILGYLALEIGTYRHEVDASINHVAHFSGFAAGLMTRMLIGLSNTWGKPAT